MRVQTLADSPVMSAAAGRSPACCWPGGQFDSRQLAVTWVECQPGSQQALHAHPAHEQVYVIEQGRGQMLAGAEACEVGSGTLVFVPSATPHAIRAIGGQRLVYVSATSPPFEAAITARGGRSRR